MTAKIPEWAITDFKNGIDKIDKLGLKIGSKVKLSNNDVLELTDIHFNLCSNCTKVCFWAVVGKGYDHGWYLEYSNIFSIDEVIDE